MDILTSWQQNGMKNKNKNKHYNAYLVHQNYHQIWENNRMLTKRERERDRERQRKGLVKEIKHQLNKLISNH